MTDNHSVAFQPIPTRACEIVAGDLLLAMSNGMSPDVVAMVLHVEHDETNEHTYLDVVEAVAGEFSMGEAEDERREFDSIQPIVKLVRVDPSDLF